jgi:hypothetical protein
MNIKIILSFIILFIFSIVISSCSDATKEISLSKPKEETTEIAILMPMTGEDSVAGTQYNHLIKMGLHDGLKSRINVTSYDGADARQVTAAMKKIIARNTKIILGPLYSELTSLISAQATAHNIIIITMSNNPVLADNRLFIFGHAPLKQLKHIVNYFLDKDYKNFITLLPASNQSRTTANIIQNLVVQKNATFAKSEFYLPTPDSINKSVQLVSENVDNLNEIDDIETKPIIYINDNPSNLNLIFNAINKYNLDKKAVIIGDNRIDIDYSGSINLIFTSSLNMVNSNLDESAKKIGINHLSFMHLLAYDIGRITSHYIGEQFIPEQFLARLNSKEAYIGFSGNLHFVDSIAQREYDIISREGTIYKTLTDTTTTCELVN